MNILSTMLFVGIVFALECNFYSMKKRSSKKGDYFETLRLKNHSNSTPSPSKKSISRENTCTHFLKERPAVELPKIFPPHSLIKHKRYPESSSREDSIFNLIGTRLKRKNSMERRQGQQSTLASELKKERPLLEKQQTQKQYFLENILSSNNIVRISYQKKQKLKVFIDEGNNSRLINELIRRRTNLKIIKNRDEANFIWSQNCDWQHSNTGSSFSQNIRGERESAPVNSDSWQSFYQLIKVDQPGVRGPQKKLRQIVINKLFVHNHLRSHYEITDKKSLFKNVKKYCQKEKFNQNDIIPVTYHVERNLDNLPEDMCKKTEIWIVKPGEDTNRGVGISVQAGRDNVMKAVRQLCGSGKSALVQEYIDPLLYKNRKFDIRCFALVTSHCGQLKAYWYKEGYLRTCCKEFNYDPNNICGHLTNDAVQKKHKDYGKFQPYNKLSYTDLEILLKSKEMNYEATLSRMKELTRMSIRSAQQKLRGQKNIFSFQVFGYDFLIDSKGKVWLIQINTNPCLQFSGSLLSRIIWHMMQNSFAIAIDPFLMELPQIYSSWREKVDKIYEDNKFECII